MTLFDDVGKINRLLMNTSKGDEQIKKCLRLEICYSAMFFPC